MGLYYFADCGYGNADSSRRAALSGIHKSQYISRLLHDIGVQWTSVAVSFSCGQKGKKAMECRGEFGEQVIISPMLPYRTKMGQIIAKVYQRAWLCLFFLTRIQEDDVVVVYHALNKLIPLWVLRKVKKTSVILEVEEIYGAISPAMSSVKKKIERAVIQLADGYIFPNQSLFDYIDDKTKPFCVVEGNISLQKKVTAPPEDGQIHVVYAGILNHDKGAAIITKIAECLSEKYVVHVIGHGEPQEIERLSKDIDAYNAHCKNAASVIYDGEKKGDDFVAYLQRCHVGLCPQIVTENYNDASFPSKISTYLANGLRVVATDTRAIRESRLSELIEVAPYEPKAIAKAIEGIDFSAPLRADEVLSKVRAEQLKEMKTVFSAVREGSTG